MRHWSRSLDLLSVQPLGRVCSEADWNSVQKVLSGDVQEFTVLFEKHQSLIHNLGQRSLPPEEIEDFTQEVFLKAYESLSQFRGEAQFSTWLFQIGKNQLTRIWTRQKKHRVEIWDQEVHGEPTDHKQVSILEILEKREIAGNLRKLIERLPKIYKIPIVLHYFENKPLKEIAETMDTKLNTIKSHIARGKGLLRRWWGHEFE